MRDTDIKQVLQKAQELKALFILGQRVIPFLEEIFRFIEEISPLLDVINTSIEDNISKMPKASMQLSKVSEATELATTEIMDTLDVLVLKSNTISKNLKSLNTFISNSSSPADAETSPDQAKEYIMESEALLNDIREDTNTIIMALQIQDITSQQLAAVNNLLETVQKRLSDMLGQFRGEELDPLLRNDTNVHGSPTNVSTLHRNIAFDANAIDSLDRSGGQNRQDHVDSIFASGHTTQAHNTIQQDAPTKSSQDDIDALFGGGQTPPSFTPEQKDSGIEDTGATSAKSSQDDIDALFGGGGQAHPSLAPERKDSDIEDGGAASQDDIDALFGNSAGITDSSPSDNTTNSSPNNATHEADDNDDDVSQNDIDSLFGNPT